MADPGHVRTFPAFDVSYSKRFSRGSTGTTWMQFGVLDRVRIGAIRRIRLNCSRAVATFEATEAAASVVFRTVASVKSILLRPF